MKTLCIDLGNTRYKAAVFQEGVQLEEISLEGDLVEAMKKYLAVHHPKNIVLSSVVHHPIELEALLTASGNFLLVGAGTQLNFSIAVDKPETVGPDRLAVLAAVVETFPKKHQLVISLGSCITYNFVNKEGIFLGGAISPGMDMRFKALEQFTAKLPAVSVQTDQLGWGIPLIGYNTVTNIQSGVIYGIICELDSLIDKYKEQFGDLEVHLTGGNAVYFAGQLKNRIFADTNLLFKGLYVLSQINLGK